jgi:general secretion pathway protein N
MIAALRRTWVRFALAGLAAYLVFLVATLPAAWLGYALERASGGALALGDPRGSVWNGRGALAVRSSSGFRGVADIEWRCNPLSIFSGRLSVALTGTASGGDLKATVGLGLGSVRLQNVEATIQAALLEQARPSRLDLGPGRVRSPRIPSRSRLRTCAARPPRNGQAGWSGVGIGDYRLQSRGRRPRRGQARDAARRPALKQTAGGARRSRGSCDSAA